MPDPAQWVYWNGKRYQLFVQMPRDMDYDELVENLRTLNLIRRQLIRQLRKATHVDRIEKAINQGLAVAGIGATDE